MVHPKSLLAGALALFLTLKLAFSGESNLPAVRDFYLILAAVIPALCFWHAFKGKQGLLGKNELYNSAALATLTLVMAGSFVDAAVTRHRPDYLFAAVFPCLASFAYFRFAFREWRARKPVNLN